VRRLCSDRQCAESASDEAKSGALLKQVSNQASEYSRVVDENKRLSRDIEQLRDQLTKKGSNDKKND
jgi:regulator of replication initiation timing